jgi:hypothetical protein
VVTPAGVPLGRSVAINAGEVPAELVAIWTLVKMFPEEELLTCSIAPDALHTKNPSSGANTLID